MAVATSYDLPQYLGELFLKQERPNALLTLVGGAGAYRTVGATEFAMGVDYTLPAASQPAILEGATPTPSQQDTNQSTNVVQIFQEAVALTYSKQGAQDAISGLAAIPGRNGELQQPGTLAFQITAKLQKIARDLNLSILKGAYQKPANNATARKTRGVRTAVTTNLFANGAVNRALTKPILEDALKAAMDNGMFMRGDTLQVFGDATQIGNLITLYETSIQMAPGSEAGGVKVRTIFTKWATLEPVWEPDLAAGELFITRKEKLRLVAMPIPNKGVLFAEPLAKSGSADTVQLYGELGIDYTNEIFHAVIDDLS